MTQVEINQDGFVIDATLLADAFDLKAEEVQSLMRDGKITSLSETGVGDDAGRARLTFYYGARTIRFVVDEAGTILKRAGFPTRARTPDTTKPETSE